MTKEQLADDAINKIIHSLEEQGYDEQSIDELVKRVYNIGYDHGYDNGAEAAANDILSSI